MNSTTTIKQIWGTAIQRCCMWCFNRGQAVRCCFHLPLHVLFTSQCVLRSGGQPPARKGAEEHEAIHISKKVQAFSKFQSVHSKWWICDASRSLLFGGSGMRVIQVEALVSQVVARGIREVVPVGVPRVPYRPVRLLGRVEGRRFLDMA
eukprot:9368105-Pyramimonas_sp.AAC.1